VSAGGLDRAWLEAVTGGTVRRLEPMAGGGSRAMYALDVDTPAGAVELVVRQEAGAGPYSGTVLGSLDREATVYRSLGGHGVPMPELVAMSDDGRTLVATRVPGSNDFHGIADADEQQAVRRDFLETLARLHHLDPAALDLESLGPAGDSRHHTRAWVGLWRSLFESHVRRPVPLLRFAFGWLDEHAPATERPPVVCHGDVGPGNFLFETGRVTGLLDWELCHLGDPHDDLGMLALRGHQLNGFGDLNEDLRHYQAVSGIDVDADQVRYHRAVALVLGLTTSVMQLDRASRARIQVPLFLHLVPTLRLLLAASMAELIGLDVEDPPAPRAEADAAALEAIEALREEVAKLPASTDAVLGAGPLDLVDHLGAVARFGRAVDAADVDDITSMLGRRVETYDEGVIALDAAVAHRSVDPAAFVRNELRSARRRAVLWPSWADAMNVPLLQVDL